MLVVVVTTFWMLSWRARPGDAGRALESGAGACDLGPGMDLPPPLGPSRGRDLSPPPLGPFEGGSPPPLGPSRGGSPTVR